MKKFKYTAINLERKKFNGIFLAEDEDELARKLAEQSLYLIKAKPILKQTVNPFFSSSGKIKTPELAAFCRQFSIMITTGISVVDAIEMLKEQAYSSMLKKTLEFMHEDIKGGMMLSQSLEKHKKIFPNFFLSMVTVGEIAGSLDKILVTLADYFETDAKIKKKTKSAMMYPLSLIIMAIGIVVLMVAFIIPTFAKALKPMGIEMPPITVFLFNASEWFKANWKKTFVYLIAGIMLLVLIGKTKSGRLFYDRLKMELPIVGKVTTNLVTARFARAFGLLIDGGLDIVDAMDTVNIVLGNKYVEKKFREATEDVRQGMSLAIALDSHKIFPPLIVQMIAVGEKSGSIADVLLRSCGFFDTQAENTIQTATQMMQPIILGVIGAIVATLFYAVYSPLLQIMNGLGG